MSIHSVKNKAKNSGQALVELALVLSFLFFLTFCITEFGRYLYQKNNATNAARSGARMAAVTSPWNPTSAAIFSAATSNFHGADVTINRTAVSGTEYQVTVTVTKPFRTAVPGVFSPSGFLSPPTSITASATMRYE